jgi:hypothetical protein
VQNEVLPELVRHFHWSGPAPYVSIFSVRMDNAEICSGEKVATRGRKGWGKRDWGAVRTCSYPACMGPAGEGGRRGDVDVSIA